MDPKKHFEVINFILRSFCELSRGDYQEKILDVTSPLNLLIINHFLIYLHL